MIRNVTFNTRKTRKRNMYILKPVRDVPSTKKDGVISLVDSGNQKMHKSKKINILYGFKDV